ncbi:hypothetical protein ACMHYB_48760 [Sorangium sp. So ce1128]
MHLHHVSGEEETAYHDQHLMLRDGRFVTKHIYAGQTRIASKMDPDWFPLCQRRVRQAPPGNLW